MNQIIIWTDMIIFLGNNPKAVTEHRHPTIQLVFAVQGQYVSKNQQGQWEDKTGLLIAPNHFHECNAKNVDILTIDITPDSSLGEWVLSNQLKGKKTMDFPREMLDENIFRNLLSTIEDKDWGMLRAAIEGLLHYQNKTNIPAKDDRIEKVLKYISTNIEQTITTKDLTEVVHLSESRLLHLFKASMGLPIRNYILWLRLKIALSHIIEKRSLTEAAYAAGFSDQAHLTRTFVKMIGLPPSIISKNSKFVQVSFPA